MNKRLIDVVKTDYAQMELRTFRRLKLHRLKWYHRLWIRFMSTFFKQLFWEKIYNFYRER